MNKKTAWGWLLLLLLTSSAAFASSYGVPPSIKLKSKLKKLRELHKNELYHSDVQYFLSKVPDPIFGGGIVKRAINDHQFGEGDARFYADHLAKEIVFEAQLAFGLYDDDVGEKLELARILATTSDLYPGTTVPPEAHELLAQHEPQEIETFIKNLGGHKRDTGRGDFVVYGVPMKISNGLSGFVIESGKPLDSLDVTALLEERSLKSWISRTAQKQADAKYAGLHRGIKSDKVQRWLKTEDRIRQGRQTFIDESSSELAAVLEKEVKSTAEKLANDPTRLASLLRNVDRKQREKAIPRYGLGMTKDLALSDVSAFQSFMDGDIHGVDLELPEAVAYAIKKQLHQGQVTVHRRNGVEAAEMVKQGLSAIFGETEFFAMQINQFIDSTPDR